MKTPRRHSTFAAALTLGLCLAPLVRAAETGLRNGDFATGKQYWRGDGTVVTLPDGNKVLELNSTTRDQNEVHQDLKLGSLPEIEVRFRARFIGDKGQMRARLVRKSGSSTLFAFDLPPEGAWRDIRFKYQRESLDDERSLLIETLLYKGKLQIDDVWAGEPGTHPSVRPMAPPTTTEKPAVPAPVPAPAAKPGPAASPAAAPASASGQMNPDVPLTAVQSAIPKNTGENPSSPGTFQEQHERIAQELLKHPWTWAPTRNYSSTVVFMENGDVVGAGNKQTNGDWRIARDGTVVYRRGDGNDRSLIWLLRVAAPGRFEGIGAGGADGRSAILSRTVDAAPILAKFNGTQWRWGSGGVLTLEDGGVAKHSAWNKEGAWAAMNATTIFVQRPANDPPMIVEFDDELSQAKVTSHVPSSTTLTRLK